MNRVLFAIGTCDGQPIQFECRETSDGLVWFTCDKLKRWVNTDIPTQKTEEDAQNALLITYPVEQYQLKASWIV
jgi:hypothetical protein